MKLKRFSEALKNSGLKLSSATLWRYQTGRFGPFGKLLMENPQLAEALAMDAKEQDNAENTTAIERDAA